MTDSPGGFGDRLNPRCIALDTHIPGNNSTLRLEMTHLSNREMSAASWGEYRTSLRDTAQNGVTLMSVSMPLGER